MHDPERAGRVANNEQDTIPIQLEMEIVRERGICVQSRSIYLLWDFGGVNG